MITIYDDLYGTTYRNITDIKIRKVTVFNVHKYRIEFWFGDGKKDIIWFDVGPVGKRRYIQLGDERYSYDEIKKDELKFKMKLTNELTKAALEALE